MTQSGLQQAFLSERPMLLRLLAARLGTREDAEDAAQELWLKLADLNVEPVAHPAAYLYRMAANLASDRRAAAMSGIARDRAWLEVQPAAGEVPDAERALIGRDRLRRALATLDAMPDRMRTAFQMFRIEGQSQKTIAEALGISVSGVEKLLQRAYRLVHDGSVEFAEANDQSTEESDAPLRLGTMKDRKS